MTTTRLYADPLTGWMYASPDGETPLRCETCDQPVTGGRTFIVAGVRVWHEGHEPAERVSESAG